MSRHDADNGRDRTVREFVAEFRGLSGTAKQKAVLDALGLARAPLSQPRRRRADRSGAEPAAARAMQAHSKPVKPAQLGIIGREHFEARFARRLRDGELRLPQGRGLRRRGHPLRHRDRFRLARRQGEETSAG